MGPTLREEGGGSLGGALDFKSLCVDQSRVFESSHSRHVHFRAKVRPFCPGEVGVLWINNTEK